MAHWTKDLEDLCEKIVEEISEANKKLTKNGGNMTAGDVETLDKLTHTLKSIKTTLAMAEYDDDDYSNEYSGARGGRGGSRGGSSRGGSSYGGSSYEGNSYARGRGRNARRDSMGRYSKDGYSRDDAMEEMAEAIRESMSDMPDELRRDAQKLLNKIDQM